MIGGDDHGIVVLSQQLEEISQYAVSEPTEGDAAERTFVIGQLTNHLRFRAGMTEHIDEIHHEHVQIVDVQVVELLKETVTGY